MTRYIIPSRQRRICNTRSHAHCFARDGLLRHARPGDHLPSGRALVECIIAIFLLAVTALTMAASVRGTLALTDDATLVAHAQALATTRVERALVPACAQSATGADVAQRVNLLWQQSGAQRVTRTHLALTLVRAPIAFAANAPFQFAIEAGGVCP